MKTQMVNRSWKILVEGLGKAMSIDGHKRTTRPHQSVDRSLLQKYSSWPRGGYLNFAVSSKDAKLRTIDIAMLERLMEHIVPKGLSKAFIASQLQLDTHDARSLIEMRRMIALKRMRDLVNATVQEIKAIDVKFIANTKG